MTPAARTSDAIAYTYAAGNLQTRTDSCGTTTYTWNVKGELTQIGGYTPAPACQTVTASFTYDTLGRRQSKTINGVTTTFLYDGMTPIQERQGATTTNLLTGPGIDEYLARTDGSTTRYFLPNHLGSTIALADPAGTITTRYTYSPFGVTTESGEGSTNPFQYTGRENDGTGLYYYRARYYDPKVQRFISSDPIGLAGGLNTYAYVENNPLSYVDPTGLVLETWEPGEVDQPQTPGERCYAKCTSDALLAPIGGLFTKEALVIAAEHYTTEPLARTYYSHRYPNWFRAGGQYSRVMVPRLAERIGNVGRGVSLVGLGIFGYQMYACAKKCEEESKCSTGQ